MAMHHKLIRNRIATTATNATMQIQRMCTTHGGIGTPVAWQTTYTTPMIATMIITAIAIWPTLRPPAI